MTDFFCFCNYHIILLLLLVILNIIQLYSKLQQFIIDIHIGKIKFIYVMKDKHYHTKCYWCKTGLNLGYITDHEMVDLFMNKHLVIDPSKYRYCDGCINSHIKLIAG